MITILHKTLKRSTIGYDSSVPCLIDTLNEFLFSHELRAHMNKGMELLIEKKRIHGEIGWLANVTNLPPLFEDDLKWIAEDWNVRAEQAGIRYVAIVTSQDDLAQMSIQTYEEKVEETKSEQLVTKVFGDLESAREWLRRSLRN